MYPNPGSFHYPVPATKAQPAPATVSGSTDLINFNGSNFGEMKTALSELYAQQQQHQGALVPLPRTKFPTMDKNNQPVYATTTGTTALSQNSQMFMQLNPGPLQHYQQQQQQQFSNNAFIGRQTHFNQTVSRPSYGGQNAADYGFGHQKALMPPSESRTPIGKLIKTLQFSLIV